MCKSLYMIIWKPHLMLPFIIVYWDWIVMQSSPLSNLTENSKMRSIFYDLMTVFLMLSRLRMPISRTLGIVLLWLPIWGMTPHKQISSKSYPSMGAYKISIYLIET